MPAELDITAPRFHRSVVHKARGDLEADIMEFLWTRPQGAGTTVRQVFEALYENRQIAYTTVMTTMARMAKKKLLRAEKHERAYIYYPSVAQEEFVSRLVRRIVADLPVSFTGEAVEARGTQPDSRTLERARTWLDESRRRRAAAGDTACTHW